MGMECKRRHLLGFPNRLGVAFIILAGLSILSGCATTETGPMAMAREIHSMTPCAMMMDAMMGGGHDSNGHDSNGHDSDEIQHEAK